MFTRSELEIKTIQELRQLCQRYGVRPTGNAGYKVSYITTLMAFPALGIQQFQESRGLRTPSFASFENIATTVDEINSPTDEQIALIRISLEGRRMNIPDRYDQERLLMIYKAKLALEQAIDFLGMR
ncbi:hypothetical protein I8748_04405 [Nostoc sp. CENA67]|uniref:Uncharacterized protein n=1 Tax=Amazonocrinis nigriterrae CENA67 TaxID=2794033 RepID=A0A8J7HKS7_9NOST|nr:hypothetical protein [Amazonocrinis nigriterrae]MBH8561427.1 hypothetical protein [Amazonocrinis nigriterrae CENA67]